MKLTDFNTVVYDNGKELSFKRFMRDITGNKEKNWIFYNSERGDFSVCIDGKGSVLHLSKEKEKLMEKDPYVKQLLDESLKHAVYIAQKSIERTVSETGALPVIKSEQNMYKDYLDSRISDTKADIIKRAVWFSKPLLTAAATIGFAYLSKLIWDDPTRKDGLSIGLFVLWSMLSITAGGATFVLGFAAEEPFRELKTIIEKYRLLKNKRKVLLEKMKATSEETTEEKRTYQDEFLNEIDVIRMLINTLPPEKQAEYFEEIQALLPEYDKRAKEILRDERRPADIVPKNELKALFVQFLPDLTSIKLKVLQAIVAEERVKKYSVEFSDLQEQLEQNTPSYSK